MYLYVTYHFHFRLTSVHLACWAKRNSALLLSGNENNYSFNFYFEQMIKAPLLTSSLTHIQLLKGFLSVTMRNLK